MNSGVSVIISPQPRRVPGRAASEGGAAAFMMKSYRLNVNQSGGRCQGARWSINERSRAPEQAATPPPTHIISFRKRHSSKMAALRRETEGGACQVRGRAQRRLPSPEAGGAVTHALARQAASASAAVMPDESGDEKQSTYVGVRRYWHAVSIRSANICWQVRRLRAGGNRAPFEVGRQRGGAEALVFKGGGGSAPGSVRHQELTPAPLPRRLLPGVPPPSPPSARTGRAAPSGLAGEAALAQSSQFPPSAQSSQVPFSRFDPCVMASSWSHPPPRSDQSGLTGWAPTAGEEQPPSKTTSVSVETDSRQTSRHLAGLPVWVM